MVCLLLVRRKDFLRVSGSEGAISSNEKCSDTSEPQFSQKSRASEGKTFGKWAVRYFWPDEVFMSEGLTHTHTHYSWVGCVSVSNQVLMTSKENESLEPSKLSPVVVVSMATLDDSTRY